MIVSFFSKPYDEPYTGYNKTDNAAEIARFPDAQHLLGHEDIGRTYKSHEECWNEGHHIGLLLTHQIDCYGPQGEN